MKLVRNFETNNYGKKRLKQCLSLFLILIIKIVEKMIMPLYNFEYKVEDGRKIK